ncbi:MAG: DotU family type IV/VI secretion system protein [Planctomycetota bacterium]|nr:MAG: DotU family type IV/VI secretion system protein [Planctomycetota bacterium]
MSRYTLVDAYAGLVDLSREVDAGEWDGRDALALADRCEDLFAEVEALAPLTEIPQAHLQLGKYALCALIDEIVLARGGNLAQQWSANPLQLRYFNDFNAGDEFFNKLESIRHGRDERQQQVLEVYHLCLCLGFTGRLSDRRGQERRRALIDNLATELAAGRPLSQDLASVDRGRARQRPRWYHKVPAWSWPFAAILVVAVVFALFYQLLSQDLQQLAQQLGAR